jgi:DNA polymerase III epsilon subunit family exonuclease
MQSILNDFDFCVVDLETTGLNPNNGSSVIEVGGVRISDGHIAESFGQLADPGHSIPEHITRITGIQNEDLRGVPSTEAVLNDFLDFAEDSILIAHNARFDLSFLRTYAPGPVDHDYIDTLRLARQLLDADKNSLTDLARKFNLSLENAHRAQEDARATAELFLRLTECIQQPEDYFRCKLPERILDKAPVDVPEPGVSFGDSDSIPEDPPLSWILYGLYELDTTLGVNKLAKILSGSNSQEVSDYQQLRSYGILSRYTQKKLKESIEGAIQAGHVQRSENRYPVLNLTKEGINELKRQPTTDFS